MEWKKKFRRSMCIAVGLENLVIPKLKEAFHQNNLHILGKKVD